MYKRSTPRKSSLLVAAFLLVFAGRAALAQSFVNSAPASSGAMPDVTAKLTDSKASVRLAAARRLMERRGTADFGALAAAAKAEANPDIRTRMLIGAFELDAASAVPLLAAALQSDPSPLVRSMAAVTLGRIGGHAGARAALIAALAKDQDKDVRRSCVAGLIFHPAAETLKALADASSDPDPELRRRVALALTRQPRSAQGDQILDKLENDSDPKVAERVKELRAGSAP